MIWLIGSRGMLGTEVETLLRQGGIQYVGTDREVDITNPNAIAKFLDTLGPPSPELMINCAAYTAVDLAEEQSETAFAVNAEGPFNLAQAARMVGAILVHFSTDYVFDGKKEGDYSEDDLTGPLSVYGESKLQGEVAVRETLEKYYVIRTAWLYGKGGKNFVDTMLQLLRERPTVRVVSDQVGNPTYAVDLARAIVVMISARQGRYGVYNFTNESRTSWYGYALAIQQEAASLGLANPSIEIVPISTGEYPTRATRPRNSCLSKEKIKQAFGLSIRGWREALRSYLAAKVGCAQPSGT